MNILIIDDNPRHLAAASEFGEHSVVTADSYETAMEILAQGNTDILLTDMLMPAEAFTLGEKGMLFFGHEMPIGFVLVLVAARNGVKYAIMATDTNHHDHPMSAGVDRICNYVYSIGGMKAWFTHAMLRPDGAKDWKRMFDLITQ
ncbi:MAG: hypothetical protein ACM3NH_02685 [Candidatus Saccharibacteria bacterium]